MPNRPVYPISIVSEFLETHPETMRVWERNGIMQPLRRSGRRFYSENDLKRMRFIKNLMAEGLNLPAIRYYLKLYPCWQGDNCPNCMQNSEKHLYGKPCWKEVGTYCVTTSNEEMCTNCEYRSSLECREASG